MKSTGYLYALASVSTTLLLAQLVVARADIPEPPPVTYPELPVTAADAKSFAPPGWMVETTASGDLDRDGRADLVFVLRDTAAKNVLANAEGLGENPFDTNPRILGVAFAGPAGQPYRLVLQNHTLIPRRDNPSMEDPFEADEGISVARGAFSVRLHLFMTAGGWGMFQSRFTFRWQGGGFALIGFEQTSTQRNTGAMVTTSVNYSTGRMRTETGSIETERRKVRTRTLAKKPLLTVEEVGDGIEFSPTE